ncbi:MAG: BON domain-containing protein [Kiritimatiellae bacterium]|nr:BON domain-containing protein [Kiritimatiellia bacterium]
MYHSFIRQFGLAAITASVLIQSPVLRASESDDQIESSFKNSYVYRKFLAEDSVKIEAEDGIVKLSGSVASESHKVLAQDTAAGLTGVIQVDSSIETDAEIESDNADAWIARKLNTTLLFHRNVNMNKTTVEVKDAVVTLGGEASSQAQKELTGEYAADIKGVKSVDNRMVVSADPVVAERTAGEKIDDASITAQVQMVLMSHQSTSETKTMVVTRNGEVTLTGIAKNAAEKALATKIVSDINGVEKVNNEMTLAAALSE